MDEERIVALTKLILDKSLEEGRTSHRTELFIISLKSLLPREDQVALEINYDRYRREFSLWKYYRESSNRVLDNILFRFDSSIYWQDEDDSLIYRVFPMVLSNKNYDSLYRELVKNILYTSGNIYKLIETIVSAKLFYLLINKYADIENSLKDEIINLSQKDFMEEFGSFFRAELDSYEGNFTIDFEKAKIEALNILNGIESVRMKNFNRLFTIYKRDREDEDLLENLILSLDERDYKESEIAYFEELGRYLLNLRKSRIDPKLLFIGEYRMPDIFEYKKGEWFDHSLLNRCQVIDKTVADKMLYVSLKTKSGIYNFRKPIRQ